MKVTSEVKSTGDLWKFFTVSGVILT